MALNPTLRTILSTGAGSVQSNVMKLMGPAKSQSRKKAILTIAKRRNLSKSDAQFVQARAIARKQASK